MGERKIEMRRIEKESARKVCFSKRRQSLFKKAKELSTLCRAGITFLVFSPAGRFYSFANTDIESILHRYCKENNDRSPTSSTTTSSNGEGGHDNFWWEKVNVEEMEEENDLQQLQKSLQEVRGKVVSHIEELSSASSLLSLVTLPSSLDLIMTTSAAAAAAVVTWPPPLHHLLPPCSVGDESAANAMNTTHVELEAPFPQPHDGNGVMQVEESLFLDFALDEDDDGLLMPVFGEEYDDGLLMKPVLEEDDGLISGPMDDMMG